MVSSASIDVMTTASPYKEERKQGSLGFDMLHGKTQYSVSYTLSDENDYTANTASFDVSQDLFGDLTTVSFGFSQGWDEVRKRGDAAFPASRRSAQLPRRPVADRDTAADGRAQLTKSSPTRVS